MIADLHVHTNYSKDGRSAPQQVVERAVEVGLKCVAITDHNEFRAFNDLKDNGRVIIIPAEEGSSSEGHIVALGIDRQIPRGLGIQETIDAIHEAGGYAFAAHPYRWWSGLGEKNTLKFPFDGVEALNARSVPHANRKSLVLAKRIGKPITAGSDAHSPSRIGWGKVTLPDTVTDWQGAVQAIMAGQAVPESVNRHPLESLRYGFRSIGEWLLRGCRRM